MLASVSIAEPAKTLANRRTYISVVKEIRWKNCSSSMITAKKMQIQVLISW